MTRVLISVAFAVACGGNESTPDARPDSPAMPSVFEQVGHVTFDDTLNQGLALAGNYAYTGHGLGSGLTITDVTNPAAPVVVVPTMMPTTEMVELVAAPKRALLFAICRGCETRPTVVVFDLTNPTAPLLRDSYSFVTGQPHEMFLWQDPATPARTLLFVTDTASATLHVLDATDPDALTLRAKLDGVISHGVSISADHARAYVSLIDDGLEVVDVSTITDSTATPVATRITPPAKRFIDCTPISADCITHSAVPVPGRDLLVVTYENTDCPKGWMNLVDVKDATTPVATATWKHPRYMTCDEPFLGMFGYGPHAPTVTPNLALVSWYRAGMLAFDISDATAPELVGTFAPPVEPQAHEGRWGYYASVSTPIVRDGLIYVLDGRNGLDIVRYTGPFADELTADTRIEGNSNL